MIPLTLDQIAEAVGGSVADGPGDIVVHGATADSRKAGPGDIYVAIVGERVDGHDFVDSARAAGAVASLTDRPVGSPAVVVADPVDALGRLAHHVLSLLPDLDIVAVTGSSGKTTTKDLLASVLARRGAVVAPVGSFNTEVGMPLTVLRCDGTTRTLVLEMGARGIGHIAYLCDIARPKVGIVLMVGSAHVGEFGSRDAIVKAKGELPASLGVDGTAVLFADDPAVRDMPTAATRLTFGRGAAADIRIESLELDDSIRPSFDLVHDGRTARVELPLAGEHNAFNAAAVAAAAVSLGMDLGEVAEALSAADPISRWRMEVTETPRGVTIINDSYNANPESMTAALKSLAEFGRRRPGRTWAVLGAMLELGDVGADEHDAIGRLAVRLNIDHLLVVGDGAAAIHLGAAHEGSWNGESSWVPDVTAALAELEGRLEPGDTVLVKASRSIGLERVADALVVDELGEPS